MMEQPAQSFVQQPIISVAISFDLLKVYTIGKEMVCFTVEIMGCIGSTENYNSNVFFCSSLILIILLQRLLQQRL